MNKVRSAVGNVGPSDTTFGRLPTGTLCKDDVDTRYRLVLRTYLASDRARSYFHRSYAETVIHLLDVYRRGVVELDLTPEHLRRIELN